MADLADERLEEWIAVFRNNKTGSVNINSGIALQVFEQARRCKAAEAERDALKHHYEAASKAAGRSMGSSRPLNCYIHDLTTQVAQLREALAKCRGWFFQNFKTDWVFFIDEALAATSEDAEQRMRMDV